MNSFKKNEKCGIFSIHFILSRHITLTVSLFNSPLQMEEKANLDDDAVGDGAGGDDDEEEETVADAPAAEASASNGEEAPGRPSTAEVPTFSLVGYLVGKGARVNAQDDYGLTPLHYAARRGNVPMAKALLNCKNVDIEVGMRLTKNGSARNLFFPHSNRICQSSSNISRKVDPSH